MGLRGSSLTLTHKKHTGININMARPLRIQFPNAWYHVMNRGRRGEKVFESRNDYECFINVLLEAVELFALRVSAFCLMPNHYHLLVQPPDANLSRGMRHINGVYTQRFNKAHSFDGQLFRGRYKAIVVEPEIAKIKQVICKAYNIDEDKLHYSKRAFFNEPRAMGMFLTRQICGESLKAIGKHFKIDSYSTVSTVIYRFKQRLSHDPDLSKKMALIRQSIMSQGET